MKKRNTTFFESLGWLVLIIILFDAEMGITLGSWVAPLWVIWIIKAAFIGMILGQIVHVSRKHYDQ